MFLVNVIVNAVALLVVAYFVPGVHVNGFVSALIAALVLGVVNAIIRPILLILTIPLTILTLGLFILILNGILFWLVSAFVPGFHVDSLGAAVIGTIVLWLVSWVLHAIVDPATRRAA